MVFFSEGGTLGLIIGGSLVFFMEICYLLKILSFGAESHQKQPGNIFLAYCANGTLHGFIFVWKANRLGGKICWALALTVFISLGSYYAILSTQEFGKNPFENTLHIFGQTVDQVQFPTITICPIQVSDPWSLQRILANQIDPLTEDGTMSPQLSADLQSFWSGLLSHVWLSDLHMHKQLDKEPLSQLDMSYIYSQL